MMVEIAADVSRVFILKNVPTARLDARAGSLHRRLFGGTLRSKSLRCD
jgi:hypothetical protein